MEGKVQVYTDNGKGRATAALGLTVRSPYAGREVVTDQFVKRITYSELKSPGYFKNLNLEQFGRDCFVYRKSIDKDYEKAAGGLIRMEVYLEDGSIDLLIFDEINVAYEYKLIDPKEVVGLFKERPKTVEVVLTGRYVPQGFINFADLVTKMKGVRHYYKRGLRARLGIKY